jgi:hypothetical protein
MRRMVVTDTAAEIRNNQQPSDIDFAIHLDTNGTFTVREANVAQTAALPYQSLDRFRVAVIGGVVQYFRNEALMFTSGKAIAYPMRVDTSLLEQNASPRPDSCGFRSMPQSAIST